MLYQPHHTGIEMGFHGTARVRVYAINRTILELK